MPAYVDPLVVYPGAWGPFLRGSCHLAADTPEELHDMARRIGMRRSWYQPGKPGRLGGHYDLTPGRRRAAVAADVVEVDFAGILAVLRQPTEVLPGRGEGRTV